MVYQLISPRLLTKYMLCFHSLM